MNYRLRYTPPGNLGEREVEVVPGWRGAAPGKRQAVLQGGKLADFHGVDVKLYADGQYIDTVHPCIKRSN